VSVAIHLLPANSNNNPSESPTSLESLNRSVIPNFGGCCHEPRAYHPGIPQGWSYYNPVSRIDLLHQPSSFGWTYINRNG